MRPVHLLGLAFLIGATAMGVLLSAVGYRWQVEAYPENAQQTSGASSGQGMPQQASAGKALFDQKCSGCHSVGGGKRTGPDLKGVTQQRPHDWLVQFIVQPDKVIASGDQTAAQLVKEFGMPMPNLGVTNDQAEQLLSYIDFQSGGTGGGSGAAPASASPAAGGAAGSPTMAPGMNHTPAASPTMAPGMTMTAPAAGAAATKPAAGATAAPASPPAGGASTGASPATGAAPAASPAAGGGNQQQAAAGKTLFDQKCTGCHSTGTDKRMGPGLQGVASQRPHDWLVQFITQPDKVIASGDPAATQLVKEYGTPMPNLGITNAQAEQLIAYLQSLSPTGGAPPGVAGGTTAAPPLPPGNPGNGEKLFAGEVSFSKGAPACIACHNVSGVGLLGGGSWGLDLTQTISKNSAAGVASIMLSPPFPGMKEAFQDHPVSNTEAADLAAFFDSSASRQPGSAAVLFPLLGLVLFGVFLILMRMVWGSRLRTVRQSLVEGTVE